MPCQLFRSSSSSFQYTGYTIPMHIILSDDTVIEIVFLFLL